MTDCLFCKIVNGEIPAAKVYEDDSFLAFLDIHPINKGHTLLIPKKHYDNILKMDDDILKKSSTIVRDLSLAINNSMQSDGINIIINNGECAGQEIFHSHTHIIPRFEDDGYKTWEPKYKYEESSMAEVAEKIKSKLDK